MPRGLQQQPSLHQTLSSTSTSVVITDVAVAQPPSTASLHHVDLSPWIRSLVAAGRLGRRDECLKLLTTRLQGEHGCGRAHAAGQQESEYEDVHGSLFKEMSSFDFSLTLWAVAKGCCYSAAREGVGETARRGGAPGGSQISVAGNVESSSSFNSSNILNSFFRAATDHLLRDLTRNGGSYSTESLSQILYAYGLYESAGGSVVLGGNSAPSTHLPAAAAAAFASGASTTSPRSQTMVNHNRFLATEEREEANRRNSLFLLVTSELASKRRVWDQEESDRTVPTIFGTLADHFLLGCQPPSARTRSTPTSSQSYQERAREQRLPLVARLVEKLFVMMESGKNSSEKDNILDSQLQMQLSSHAAKIRSNVRSLAVLANSLSRISLLYPPNDRTGHQLRKLQLGVWESIAESECSDEQRLGIAELRTLLAAMSRTRRMTDQGAGASSCSADVSRFLGFLAEKIKECMEIGTGDPIAISAASSTNSAAAGRSTEPTTHVIFPTSPPSPRSPPAPAALANLAALSAYTFAQCRFHPGDAFLETCSTLDFARGADRDFASLIFGFAVLNYDGFRPERHREALRGLLEKTRNFRSTSCSSSASKIVHYRNAACAVWSLCALEHYEVARGLYNEVFPTLSSSSSAGAFGPTTSSGRSDWSFLPDTEKMQLAYARLSFKLFCRHSTSDPKTEARRVQNASPSPSTFLGATSTTPPVSTQMHSQIYATIKSICAEAACEGVLPDSDGLLLVDVVLPQAKIAVEVDGNRHFLARGDKIEIQSRNAERADQKETAKLPDGPTLLKHRLIRKLGWRLVVITADEWKIALGLDEEEKKKWMRDEIFGRSG